MSDRDETKALEAENKALRELLQRVLYAWRYDDDEVDPMYQLMNVDVPAALLQETADE